jgi:hypothetical protein
MYRTFVFLTGLTANDGGIPALDRCNDVGNGDLRWRDSQRVATLHTLRRTNVARSDKQLKYLRDKREGDIKTRSDLLGRDKTRLMGHHLHCEQGIFYTFGDLQHSGSYWS